MDLGRLALAPVPLVPLAFWAPGQLTVVPMWPVEAVMGELGGVSSLVAESSGSQVGAANLDSGLPGLQEVTTLCSLAVGGRGVPPESSLLR